MAILLRDPFTADDFEELIAERQRTFQEAIENLLVKERLDLPVQLRELDEQIEQIELGLRRVIVKIIQDNSRLELPPHITTRVTERIQRAAKKNAALDSDYYDSLQGKMEYSDLRELQDIIVTKALWPEFQPCFINKETLITKFGQLAELRNAIRHSRTADEITRKEGEAAILWFAKVLEK